MERVTLVGAETVHSAACTMQSAAHEMHRAANTISEVMRMHMQTMQELIEVIREQQNKGK